MANKDVYKVIKLCRDRFDEERAEFIKKQEDIVKENEHLKLLRDNELIPLLRKAKVSDYVRWIDGYISSGGEPTHSYDYKFPDDFYVAKKDFKTIGLCGALAIHIIVPAGIKYLGGDRGHCNIYLMEGYKNIGSFVPIYSNI